MVSKTNSSSQTRNLFETLAEQCDPRHPLVKLAKQIPWQEMEERFCGLYSEKGRPAKPIRLMMGLLLLKQMHDQSDQSVVERWVENPYWQAFCGMERFQWELPCDPSELVYFRNRIGTQGVEWLLDMSLKLHGPESMEKEVVIDSTVQEKNITYPTDTKQYRKIIERCWKLADKEGIKLRRRYRKEVRRCLMIKRSAKERVQNVIRSNRRLRTIARVLIRELKRKLPESSAKAQKESFELYEKVLNQKSGDKEKIYSLHEPGVYCMAKGKEHKKYEFGTKASIAMTKTNGLIVAAVAHEKNLYDGHTLETVLAQAQRMSQQPIDYGIVDRGYRGRKQVAGTQILVPSKAPKDQSAYQKAKMRKRFQRRAAIEAVISHLKNDYKLKRCMLKGFQGDQINLMLAAAAWNIRKWILKAHLFCLHLFQPLLFPVRLFFTPFPSTPFFSVNYIMTNSHKFFAS